MTRQEIERWINRKPFKPFRVHTSQGKSFDITHAYQTILTGTNLVVGIEPDAFGRVKSTTYCEILKVLRIEDI